MTSEWARLTKSSITQLLVPTDLILPPPLIKEKESSFMFGKQKEKRCGHSLPPFSHSWLQGMILSGHTWSSSRDRCAWWQWWYYWSLSDHNLHYWADFLSRTLSRKHGRGLGTLSKQKAWAKPVSILTEPQSLYRSPPCSSPSEQQRLSIGSSPQGTGAGLIYLSRVCVFMRGGKRVNYFFLLGMPYELKHFNGHVMLPSITILAHFFFFQKKIQSVS